MLGKFSNAQDGLLIKQLQVCSVVPTHTADPNRPSSLVVKETNVFSFIPGMINMHLLSELCGVIYPDYLCTRH